MTVKDLRELLSSLPEGMTQEQFDETPAVYLQDIEDADGNMPLIDIRFAGIDETAEETETGEILPVFMIL